MAFPETILPILVDISLDGTTWTDITDDARRAQQVRITRGRSDWGQQVDFGRCSFALTNTDGKYSPRNPEGPYYGQIGRNTPVRISVESGSVAALVPGATGDFISTPDTGVLDITGDIDIRFDGTLANWVPADYSIIEAGIVVSSRTELIGKSTLGQRSWNLYIHEGNLMLEWSTDGSTQITQESTEPLPVPASGRLAVRATLDVNNGFGGYDVEFFTSDSIDGVWAKLGETVTGAGATSIFSGSAPVRIADSTSTVYTEAIGYVHAAEIRTGIGDVGTVVADPRFSEQASGTTSFTDDAGRTWTVAGQTEISSRKIRFVGEISSWPSRWETGGFDVTAEVEASGLLRRLGKGAVPAKSPVVREFTAPSRTSIVGYWPMEDEAEATELASAISGHPGLRITGTVTPAAYSDWVASAPVAEIGTGSLRVNMPTYTATTAMFMRMFVAVPAAGVVSTQRLISFTTTGTARTWSLYVTTSGGLELEAYDADGTTILNPGPVAFAVNGKRKSLGIELTQSGANIAWTVFSLDLDDSTLDSASATSTGATLNSYTFGTVTQIRLGEDGAMNDTAVGHLAVANDSTAFGSTLGPLIGWDGEIAASRVHRLGFEEGFHSYATRIGDERMGVQTRAAILDLLRQAEGVDEGILCEQRDLLGLRYVQRRSLYNQLPDLTLDYEGNGLVTPLDPEEDDQNLTNDVTVQRSGGSSARLTLDEGPLSTLAPPNGVGLYDTSHTLSLYDDTQPPFHAGWKLHLGTWDELRFPVVSVNLAAAPELIDDAASVDIGSRLQITNSPVWLPPDTIDLMVQGYTEVFDQTSWQLAFNCTPAGPYSVAFEGDGIYDRADTDGSELAEDLTTTETPVDVMVTEGPVWVTAPAPLNSNTSFQTDTTGWSGFGSTIARVPIPGNPKFIGSWALMMTPDGVEEFPNAGGEQVPVTVGASYTLSGWLRCARSRTVALNINWFDGSSGYLSTSSNDEHVIKHEWTYFELTAVAPVGAVTANAAPTVPDFPPSTDVLWCTHIMIRPAGGSPAEFPFDVRVGGEVARVIGVASAAADTFTRTASASTWGTPTTGSAWVNTGGVAADHYTTGTEGAHRLTAVDVARLDLTSISGTDALLQVDIATAALATGGPQLVALVARAVDGDNCYLAQLSISTAQVITLTIRKRAGGVESELGSYTTRLTHSAFAFFRLKFQVIGSEHKAKVWAVAGLEPDWQVEVSEGALVSGSNVGCRSVRQTANTNANLIISWDNFELLSPQTFTVIRSINGVEKTHSAGADLRLAYPAYAPL